MERDVLRFFLRAGPSRKFDVGFFSRRLPPDGEGAQPLFATAFLNQAILFKYVEVGAGRPEDDIKPVSTLIFLPYDRERPGDGGEGFFFSEENLLRYCEYRLAHYGDVDREIADDIERLRALNSVPTFSPFIVELAFQRAGLTIPPAYLQLSPELRTKLTGLLKSRIRPLIVAAFKSSDQGIEKAVEDLTSKLFSTTSVSAILPLVRALRLSPLQAQDVLTSWLGIAYFEHEYAALQPKVREFASWLNGQEQGHIRRGQRAREYTAHITPMIKRSITTGWNDVVKITTFYRRSYEDMVFNSRVEEFISFLMNVQVYYWKMGEVLGSLEQTIVVWKHYVRRFRSQVLPDGTYFEMLDLLRSLHMPANSRGALDGASLGLWSIEF
jgi:hypothetical protein